MGTRLSGKKNVKYTTAEVHEYCDIHNIRFLDEEYISNNHPHNWLCIKHNQQTTQMLTKIKARNKLRCCSAEDKRCLTQVHEFTKNTDVELVDRFLGAQHPNVWRCKVHNQTFVNTFFTLRRLKDKRLPCCKEHNGHAPNSLGFKQYTIKEVQQMSLDRGYVFTDDKYTGTSNRHRWKCIKHDQIRTTTFGSILRGRLLRCCRGELNSGPNHPNYNRDVPDIQRIKDRRSAENKRWRNAVIQRDNHTCQKCTSGISKTKLNAHHIMSYLDNEHLRFDVNNGITLCVECHRHFHRIYGNGSNNVQQLLEFMKL